MAVPLPRYCTLRNLSRVLNYPKINLNKYLSINIRNRASRNLVVISVRYFSSENASQSTSITPVSSDSTGSDASKTRFDLSFEEYQKLRRKLRSRQRIAGLPIAAVALMTSSAVSAYLNPNMFDAPPDQIQPIMGVDPLIFCGLCGVASAGVGYFLGSAMFGSMWRLFNKDTSKIMQERESDFLERINTKRASTFSKFEDDYYGENIKSLSDYRQWLREQQKKKKAAESFEKKMDKEEQPQERATELQ